jgi:hypothetical protein
MAGQIIISNIKTDSDNAFSILANTGAVLFSANLASGITTGIPNASITNAKLAGSITGDKITVGTLAGNVFTANTITGDKIGQSAISSNNIVSVDGSNCVFPFDSNHSPKQFLKSKEIACKESTINKEVQLFIFQMCKYFQRKWFVGETLPNTVECVSPPVS